MPMSTAIDLRKLPARLGEALAVVSAGGEVLITDAGRPRARLVPCGGPTPRSAGLHPGTIQAGPDFDAPLPEDFWPGAREGLG